MTQARETMEIPPRRAPAVSGKHLVVTLLLVGLLTCIAIVWFIYRGQQRDRLMEAPPVGAGAGQTGMHNEHMGKRRIIPPPSSQPPATIPTH